MHSFGREWQIVRSPFAHFVRDRISAERHSVLLSIGDRFENSERLAHGIRCPDLLWQLLLIVLDQTVRRIDDVLGRSVILFEFEDLCVRVVAFEVEYVLDVRPRKE